MMQFSARLSASVLVFATMLCAPAAKSETETTLWNFGGHHDGTYPLAGMKRVSGILYGTTEFGGSGSCDSGSGAGCGVIFSFDPATGQEKVVYAFAGGTSDGELPYSRLAYAKGVLYGTTYMGGSSDLYCYNSFGSGCGTVFSINLSTGKETVLYSFRGGGADGIYPLTAPIFSDSKGELFGTTADGGTGNCTPYGCGTVFKMNLANGKETVVHTFQNDGGDGINPSNDWTKVGRKLYSTTTEGGTYGAGTIFCIDSVTGRETVLHSFGSGADGHLPIAGMTQINDVLYGTTFTGGAGGAGAIFSFDPATDTEDVVYSFHNNRKDGVGPAADLIHWKGLLYGTTSKGGANGWGTVFSFDPNTGVETVLYSNYYGNNEPYNNNRLMHFRGKIYGTIPEGGEHLFGTIFSLKR